MSIRWYTENTEIVIAAKQCTIRTMNLPMMKSTVGKCEHISGIITPRKSAPLR